MDTYLPKDFAEMFDKATARLTQDARIMAVLAAYDRALEDKSTHIPTTLHAAIEALRK